MQINDLRKIRITYNIISTQHDPQLTLWVNHQLQKISKFISILSMNDKIIKLVALPVLMDIVSERIFGLNQSQSKLKLSYAIKNTNFMHLLQRFILFCPYCPPMPSQISIKSKYWFQHYFFIMKFVVVSLVVCPCLTKKLCDVENSYFFGVLIVAFFSFVNI